MSNENRIHLLSLAAGTLGHLVRDQGFDNAKIALDSVLKDIESLTETSIRASAKVAPEQPQPFVAECAEQPSKYANEETRASAGVDPELSVGTPCGCGDPACTMIDVLLGNRTDYTVESLLASFDKEFSPKEVAIIVIDATDRIQQGIEDDSLTTGPVLAKNLLALGVEGKKRAKAAGYNSSKGAPKLHVVENVGDLEKLLDNIFGKRETRH